MLHTGAWVAWLLAAAVPAFVLRNPLYLALVLAAAWIVYASLGRTSPIGSSWGSFIRLGLFLFLLTIPFNALSVHVGQIVLFQLPEHWPIVGGPITLEAIIAGAINGLSLFTILVVFAAFNAVVDHYQLLRATPAFLFQAGVVISIAITFVPQMVLSAQEIRQAQRIRGHRIRGIRDLLPLIMPLLASALERAIQLAETMEARGFGSASLPAAGHRVLLEQLGTLAGLLVLLAGLFMVAFLAGWSLLGWGLAIAGVVAMLAIFVLQGRRVRRTRYRRTPWTWRDTVVAAASAVVIGVVTTVRQVAPELVSYLPYPPNPLLPPFNSWIGATLLLLVVPALVATRIPSVESPTTESVS